MEPQAEAVQVAEDAQREAPDRALRDGHEHHVAQLAEHRRREAQDAVGRKQRDGDGDHRGLHIQAVDHRLHHERHTDVGKLRRDQAG